MELFAADGHDAGGCERVTGKSGMRPSETHFLPRSATCNPPARRPEHRVLLVQRRNCASRRGRRVALLRGRRSSRVASAQHPMPLTVASRHIPSTVGPPGPEHPPRGLEYRYREPQPDERPYARVVQSYECVRQHLDIVGGGRDRRQGARAHRAAPGRGHGGVAEGPRGRERRAVRGNRANRGRRGAGPHAGRRRRGFQGGAVHIGGLLVPKPPSMPCSSGVGVFMGEALFRATANPKPRKNAKRCSCTARPQREAGVEESATRSGVRAPRLPNTETRTAATRNRSRKAPARSWLSGRR